MESEQKERGIERRAGGEGERERERERESNPSVFPEYGVAHHWKIEWRKRYYVLLGHTPCR